MFIALFISNDISKIYSSKKRPVVSIKQQAIANEILYGLG
jgi:hypothetical protein